MRGSLRAVAFLPICPIVSNERARHGFKRSPKSELVLCRYLELLKFQRCARRKRHASDYSASATHRHELCFDRAHHETSQRAYGGTTFKSCASPDHVSNRLHPQPVRGLDRRPIAQNPHSNIPSRLFIPFHWFTLVQNDVFHGCCHLIPSPQVSGASFRGPPTFSPRVTTREGQLSCSHRLNRSLDDVRFTCSPYHRMTVRRPHVDSDQIPLSLRANRFDRFQYNPSGCPVQLVRSLRHPSSIG